MICIGSVCIGGDDLYGVVTGDMEVMVLKSQMICIGVMTGDMEVMVLKSVISDDLYRSCDWRHGGHGFKVCDIR